MTLAKYQGVIMAKDYLDLSSYETKEFKTPKIIYYIEADRGGCTIHHYNCYAIHKRKKDFLVRRKVNVWRAATPKDATQFRWRKFERHLITFDLNYAKKIAVLEAEKSKTKRIARVQKEIERYEERIAKEKLRQDDIRNKVWTEEDVRENDANKDETYMAF
jgi:hypothetical protein